MTNVTLFFRLKKVKSSIYLKISMLFLERTTIMSFFAKFLLLLLCAFFQFQKYTVNSTNIILLLVVFVLSSIPIIIQTNTKPKQSMIFILSFIWSIWLICSFFFKELHCYFPLILFDIWTWKIPMLYILAIFRIIVAYIIEYTTYTTIASSFFLSLLSVCAILLQQSIYQSETLLQELKQFRDTSKEHELLIEEKNRRLREQQDAELYTATLKERNRIAREIHDNVGHLLTRSLLQVGAIKTINQNETLKELLEALHETLNTAMTSIRNSVHDLHNDSIDLHSAIQEIINNVTTISIQFDYNIHTDVSKSIKYCFIAITKEAINNTIKHSNATKIHIIIQEHPAFYQLLIQDNGTNNSENLLDGIGIENMKDRVKVLQGTIKISNENGFKILVSIFKIN